MRVRFWGTRGSIPTPGPATTKYGGNTSCVEVLTDDGTHIILDCGSGARDLGQHLLKSQRPESGGLRLHLFIGHTHWDHIQGFPFFVPAFLPDSELNIYAAAAFQRSLEESLSGQMQYAYFPVKLRDLQSRLHFTDLEEGFFRVGDVLVETQHLNHTAPTMAYRLTADGATVAYTTDHEPFWKPGASDFRHPGDQRHIGFLQGADLVIHDSQYTEAEYPQKIGWGHSTVEYATDVCLAAGVGTLALFHHDPTRDDAALEQIEAMARDRIQGRGSSMDVFAAAEGLSIDVVGRGSAPRQTGVSAIRRYSINGRRVLLVGLEDTTREALSTELGEENLTLLYAPDAPTALERVEAMSPDLVVVSTPLGRRSRDLVRDLRERSAKDSLPVLMLATEDDLETQIDQLGADATDYLAAPLSPPMVRSRVRAWLARASTEPVERLDAAGSVVAAEPPRPPVIIPRPTDEAGVDRLADVLSNVPIFRSLTPEQIRLLAQRGSECVFEPGYTIIRQHEAGTQVFVILTGRVRVLEETEEPPRGDTVVAELGQGEIFGEMAVLIDRPRSATVVSVEQTHCLALPAGDFSQVLRASPDLALTLLRVLAGRINETDRRLARYAPDPLTGLSSRRAFFDEYARTAAQARRRGSQATLVTLDLVNLRALNDHFGYEVGDDVLRAVADALSESARRTDLIARYGGDEFAVLLIDVNPESIQVVVNRVRRVLVDLARKRGLPETIECAFGIASVRELPESPDELLVRADEDMQRRRAVG